MVLPNSFPHVIAQGPMTDILCPSQVRSLISVEDSRDWVFGIRLVEAQRSSTYFRLWRFYPGPPTGVIE